MGSWKNKITATEILEERANRDFPGQELRVAFTADEKVGAIVDKVIQDQNDHPFITNHHSFYEMSPEEKQLLCMKKLHYMWTKMPESRKFYFTSMDTVKYIWFFNHLGQPVNSMHISMFSWSMNVFPSEEQKKKWQPLIDNFDILGCYAQTELGHGTDVNGIETTATYDKEKQEFVLHTPTLSATKWWPGDMGRFANHALVMAKIIVPEDDGEVNDYGVGPFIMQIRCSDTHKHMPGIKTGDMGPKFGYSSKDNGWMTMDKVRIPRENLLSGFVEIDKEGSFSLNADPRILFSVMLRTRCFLFSTIPLAALAALTIAIRYSVVRRQFKNISGVEEETKLLDYQTQQMKLFPILAQSFAMASGSEYVNSFYDQLIEDIKDKNFDKLELMHHFSAGFKSVYTQQCVDGLFVIRQSLGGAGFSAWSSIPRIIDDTSAQVTYEGDNTVMAQQSYGYLDKTLVKILKGETNVHPLFKYLFSIKTYKNLRCTAKTADDFMNIELIEEALKVKICHQLWLLTEARKNSDATKKDFLNSEKAEEIVNVSQDHIKFISFLLFKYKIYKNDEIKMYYFSDAKLIEHCNNMLILNGLTQLNDSSQHCFAAGYFQSGVNYTSMILDAIKKINLKIRPQALNIVESIDYIQDGSLCSAIGNSYGDIYETHLEWAQNSRLNKTKQGDAIPDGYMEYMMPLLKGKM